MMTILDFSIENTFSPLRKSSQLLKFRWKRFFYLTQAPGQDKLHKHFPVKLFSIAEWNCRLIEIHLCLGSLLNVFHNQIYISILMLVQQRSVPVQQWSVPVQQWSVPVQQRSVPVQQWSVPVQQRSVPVQQLSVPVQQQSVPVQQWSVHVQQRSVLVQQRSVPVQQWSVPIQQRSEYLYNSYQYLYNSDQYLYNSDQYMYNSDQYLYKFIWPTFSICISYCNVDAVKIWANAKLS